MCRSIGRPRQRGQRGPDQKKKLNRKTVTLWTEGKGQKKDLIGRPRQCRQRGPDQHSQETWPTSFKKKNGDLTNILKNKKQCSNTSPNCSDLIPHPVWNSQWWPWYTCQGAGWFRACTQHRWHAIGSGSCRWSHRTVKIFSKCHATDAARIRYSHKWREWNVVIKNDAMRPVRAC